MPSVYLYDADDQPVFLASLVESTPTLVVNAHRGCGSCDVVLERLKDRPMIAETVAVQIIENKFSGGGAEVPGLLWDKGKVARALGITRYPATVLIGADGTIPADPVCGSAEVLRLIDAIEEAVAHNRTGSPVLPGASTDVL